MRRFWKRDHDPVDAALRAARREAPDELVDELGSRVTSATRPESRRWSRAAFVAGVAVLMLGTFASFGGLGYASGSAQSTVHTVKRALAPAKSAVPDRARSAARSQYEDEKVQETTTTPSTTNTNTNNVTPVVQVAGATGGTPAAATTDTLPFTGYGLGATAAIGSLLLALGAFLRRRESKR